MVVETKFNIGQKVFFLKESKIETGTIHSVETYSTGGEINKVQYYLRTTKGLVAESHPESILFSSREDLVNSL